MLKREFFGQLATAAGIIALPLAIEAEAQRERKPVTTAGLAQSVLGLAKKAEQDGLQVEAKILREAALKLLGGK